MRFKNVSPLGALDLPLAGRVVGAGEVIEVTEAQAAHLTGQADWLPVLDEAGPAEAAEAGQEDTPTRPRRRKTKQEGETGDDSE